MATGDNVIDCANKEMLSLYDLLNSCFGIDGDGKIYLRTHTHTQEASEGDAVTCSTNTLTSSEMFEHLVRSSIVLNAEGKPALRLGTL